MFGLGVGNQDLRGSLNVFPENRSRLVSETLR